MHVVHCRSWNKLFGVLKVVLSIFSNEHVLSLNNYNAKHFQ